MCIRYSQETKLNELGQESLAKGIPPSANETVLAQSQKVDELVTRFHVQKWLKGSKGIDKAFVGRDEVMEFPSWFQSAIQERLDEVSARIQFQTDLRKYREEEKNAFEALFSGVNMTQCPEYSEWKDKHHYYRGLENERLYLQGMRDGARLAIALMSDPFAEQEGDANSARSKSEH